ncbi:hypothetical protein GCM10010182_19050 [Actinomadura cremea]|nr:hypothetical protein GCM10010182_19050 [Actinomadura cremea]
MGTTRLRSGNLRSPGLWIIAVMSVLVDICLCAVPSTAQSKGEALTFVQCADRDIALTMINVLRIFTMSSPKHADDGRFLSLLHRLGGAAMLISPLLLLVGESIRIRVRLLVPEGPSTGFDYPGQLAAYQNHPALMTASYVVFALGWFALWPAFLSLAALIGRTRPWWGLLGGASALTGLIALAFYEGINHLAFQLVDRHGLTTATAFLDEAYTSPNLAYALTAAYNLGWIVLAIGACLSRTLGPWRSLCLAPMTLHATGVLKAGEPHGIAFILALMIAFIPLGLALVRGTTPTCRTTAHRSGTATTT